MKIPEYLDAARVELKLPSDYALAKHMKVSKETISQLRIGKMHLSDGLAIQLADILGRDRLELLAAASFARAKTPEAQAVWVQLMGRIAEGFLSLVPRANSGKRMILTR